MDIMGFLIKYMFTLTTSSILGMATLFASEISSEETDSSAQLCSDLEGGEATARVQNSSGITNDELKTHTSKAFADIFDKERLNDLYGSEFVDSFIKTLDPDEAVAQQKWDKLADPRIPFDDMGKREGLEKLKEKTTSFDGPKEIKHSLLEDKMNRMDIISSWCTVNASE